MNVVVEKTESCTWVIVLIHSIRSLTVVRQKRGEGKIKAEMDARKMLWPKEPVVFVIHSSHPSILLLLP